MKGRKHQPEPIIRKLREADSMFAITDEYTRECLALEVERSITADRIVDLLTDLFHARGVPKHLRSRPPRYGGARGPDFIAREIRGHAERAGLEMLYIEPGAPWENGFAESFFSRLRDELLNVEEFMNLAEARLFCQPTTARAHELATRAF